MPNPNMPLTAATAAAAALLLLCFAAPVAAGIAWTQRAGTYDRLAAWFESDGSARPWRHPRAAAAAAAAAATAPFAPAPDADAAAAPLLRRRHAASVSASAQATVSIPAAYFRTATRAFQFIKTSSVVSSQASNVLFVTADCQLYVLPSPTTVGSWDSGALFRDATYQPGPGPLDSFAKACYDLVLDWQDNVYVMRHNASAAAFVHGWRTRGFVSQPLEFLVDPTSRTMGIFTGGEARIAEIFSIGLTYTPPVTTTGFGSLWVPLVGTDSVGLALVTIGDGTTGGTLTRINCGGLLGEQGSAGGAGLYIEASDDVGAVFANDGELDARTSFLTAYRSDGSVRWVSTAQGQAGFDQPPPLVDPVFGSGGRIFSVEHPVGNPVTRIFCTDGATGSSCPPPWSDAGVVIEDVFKTPQGSYNISWIYSASSVYSSSTYTLLKLFYSLTLKVDLSNEPFPLEPTGCVLAVDPNTGQETDFYCVPRDESSFYAPLNYIATAPIIAMNARGPGMHNLYVAQADCVVLAFDATNLAKGPLFSVLPFSARGGLPTGVSATVASDFLSMTAEGSLVFPYWESLETGSNGYGVVAIPNINSFVPSPAPSPGPSQQPAAGNAAAQTPGLSPGGAAGVSIAVLLLVGGLAGVVYKAGGVAAAATQYLPSALSPRGSAFLGGPSSYKYVSSSSSTYTSSSSSSLRTPTAYGSTSSYSSYGDSGNLSRL